MFDRIEVVQGDTGIRFRDRNHRRVGDIAAAGAPEFHEMDLFRVPEGSTLDITRPWRLQLLVQRAIRRSRQGIPDLSMSPTICPRNISGPYRRLLPRLRPQLPQRGQPRRSAAAPESEEPPLWQTMWRAKTVDIGILVAALLVLTGDLLLPGLAGEAARLL